jgi:hypothetical protein
MTRSGKLENGFSPTGFDATRSRIIAQTPGLRYAILNLP